MFSYYSRGISAECVEKQLSPLCGCVCVGVCVCVCLEFKIFRILCILVKL